MYAVINKATRRAYVGSSVNLARRLAAHRSCINTGYLLDKQAYADDARTLGVAGFDFLVLRTTNTLEEARELETAFLECFFGNGLYNRAPHANGSTGVKRIADAYKRGAAKRLQNPGFSKRLAEACRGKRAVLTCPYCGVEGGGGNMRRYHFEKCKAK